MKAMKMCKYQHDPCGVKDCKVRNPKNCALYGFLNTIEKESSNYPEEKALIESLKTSYVDVWNKRKRESVAIGRATGDVFAKWVTEKSSLSGKGKKDKKVEFGPIKFTVDFVIPSAQDPKVVLEIKMLSDIQHTLTLKGLLDYSPEDRKLGYVTFIITQSDIIKLLDEFKVKYKDEDKLRFDYFIITGPDGWSKAIERLKAFCSI